MARLPLDQGIPRFKANEERIDLMTNGDEDVEWTTSDGVTVPSVRKWFADINTEGEGWMAKTEAAADQAALYEGPWLDDVSELLADTTLTYSAGTPSSVVAGDYVRTRAEGFSYRVMPAGATLGPSGYHVATAGGVKLKVVSGARGYDVRAFGAVSGAAAQDAPIDLCLTVAAANYAPAYFPKGQWTKTTFLEVTLPIGDGGFSIIGDGDGVSNIRLNTGGDGLRINLPGSWWMYSAGGSTALMIEGIAFSTTNANLGVGVKVVGQSVEGRPGPSVRFNRCMWRAHSNFSQFWARGLEVIDCQNTWYDMCRWECGGPSNTTAKGVFIGGTAQANSPTLHYFNNCTWDYGDISIEIGDFVEGVYLSKPTIVASNTGVRWHPSQGESGLVVEGGHINTKKRWIDINNVFDFEIYGNHMYRQGGDTDFRGVLLQNAGRGVITGNMMKGRGVSDGADIGIEVRSLINSEGQGLFVGGNAFHNWQTRALWAGANANYLKVGINLYRNCATNILNQSSNNSVSIQAETFARTVNHVFTGGATTETVDIPLPVGLFRVTPIGLVTIDSASRLNIRGFYDFANSTATTARFVFENPAGGNLVAGTRRFHVHISENISATM